MKLTEPLTAILYITADHRHMRELKEAIHVREIAEGGCGENLSICIRGFFTLHTWLSLNIDICISDFNFQLLLTSTT